MNQATRLRFITKASIDNLKQKAEHFKDWTYPRVLGDVKCWIDDRLTEAAFNGDYSYSCHLIDYDERPVEWLEDILRENDIFEINKYEETMDSLLEDLKERYEAEGFKSEVKTHTFNGRTMVGISISWEEEKE